MEQVHEVNRTVIEHVESGSHPGRQSSREGQRRDDQVGCVSVLAVSGKPVVSKMPDAH